MRATFVAACLAGVLLLFTSDANAEMRKWTNEKGKAFQAEFVKMEQDQHGNNIVTLRKPDGMEMTVRLAQLTEEDRNYVEQLPKAEPAKPENTSPRAPVSGRKSDAPDQPPADPGQQREWLRAHVLKDAESTGTFDSDATAKASSSLQELPDDQVALLCQYYMLTRSKTEQDAGLYALQQQGASEQQINEAKAGVADLMSEMQSQGDACYSQVQTLGEPAQCLAQIVYASIPGWCVSTQCYVPAGYYSDGNFIGPWWNARYCGVYAPLVYHAYDDRTSHFYRAYHSVDDRVYRRHSVWAAHRSARYFHEHDYHRLLAHDRFHSASAHERHPGDMDHGKNHAKANHPNERAKAEHGAHGGKAAAAAKHDSKSAAAGKHQAKAGANKKAKGKRQPRQVKKKKRPPAHKVAGKNQGKKAGKGKKASAHKPKKAGHKPAKHAKAKPAKAKHKH